MSCDKSERCHEEHQKQSQHIEDIRVMAMLLIEKMDRMEKKLDEPRKYATCTTDSQHSFPL